MHISIFDSKNVILLMTVSNSFNASITILDLYKKEGLYYFVVIVELFGYYYFALSRR